MVTAEDEGWLGACQEEDRGALRQDPRQARRLAEGEAQNNHRYSTSRRSHIADSCANIDGAVKCARHVRLPVQVQVLQQYKTCKLEGFYVIRNTSSTEVQQVLHQYVRYVFKSTGT